MDLSFISLTKVPPAVWQFMAADGHLIALVKPQFEADKHEVDAGKGIIRNPEIHQRVLQSVCRFAIQELPACHLLGSMESPIKGTDGNLEFLIGLQREP